MNIRKDIYEKVKFMLKEDPEIKINYAKLGRQFNCDPRTIKKHVEAVTEEKPVLTRVYKKKTDSYEAIIEEKVRTGAPAIAIYHYLVKYEGYSGSYSTLKSYIHKLHRNQQHAAVIRFETTPGLQAQVDWKESLKFKTTEGEVIKFNVFLLTLGFSRFRFLMATESRDLFQVEFCLACAFKYIGGVPHEILFDNMRSIIDKSRTQYSEPIFNNEFSVFASDCGFVPKACVAYRPETKGKVEVTAKLMNRLKVYSGDIHSFDDIKRYTRELNEDINCNLSQATDKIPADLLKIEQEYLIDTDLSILHGYFEKPIRRKVSREALITYEGRKYSVLPQYIGKHVEINDYGDAFDVLLEDKVITHWEKTSKKYNYDKDHYLDILRSGSLKDLDDDEITQIAERNMEIYDKL
jgi:transposase